MASRLSTETGTHPRARPGVDRRSTDHLSIVEEEPRRSTDHLSIVEEEPRPLSLCERWRLGFALLVASILIEVAERLPRLNQFELGQRPVRSSGDPGKTLVLVKPVTQAAIR